MQVLILVLVLLLLAVYLVYVGLIKKKNKVQEAFSGIDVQLKKRTDLITNILAIAKRYMQHEAGLLEEITRLRSEATKNTTTPSIENVEAIKEKLAVESQLSSKMGSFMVSVENYPELKADNTMIQAQKTYNEVEEHIAASRRFYNSSVLELNNAVEIFPSSVIAGMLNLKPMPFFEASEEDRQAPNAAELLN